MENVNNLNDEPSRINTSDSKDYSKSKQRDDIKKTVIINFSIIREVFNIINFSKFIKMSDFYFYLYTQNASMKDIENLAKIDDCADLDPTEKINKIYRHTQQNYDALIRNGGQFKKIFQTLAEYGISDEYHKGQTIIADKKIIKIFNDYYFANSIKEPKKNEPKTRKEIELKECKEILKNNIFSVKNLDGSLVIDSMRDMLMDILDTYDVNRNDEYALVNKITANQPDLYLTRNQLMHYYKDVANVYIKEKENNQQKEIDDIIFPNLPQGKKPDRKTHNSKSDIIGMQLFFIREVYRLFAQIDVIPNHMENFYAYLDITESDYDKMINNDTTQNKKIIEKLKPYKYPITCFRVDSPTSFINNQELVTAYYNLKNKKINTDEFQTLLKLDFCYKIPKENIGLALATYALIKGINDSTPSYYNTLNPDEKELYHQLVKLNSMT